jgi:phospholipid transport system substrate-binding protein
VSIRRWVAVALLAPVLVFAEIRPEELVDQVARSMLVELNERRDQFTDDPASLESLIRRELIAHFDVDYAARLILGRHGRGVPAEKIDRFAEAMIGALVKRYASGLLEFRTTDQYEILPLSGNNTERLTRVRTLIRLDDGGTVPVDYAFHLAQDGWKVFDVTIEGISYIATYRNQFSQEISADGLDAVIERLETDQAVVDG